MQSYTRDIAIGGKSASDDTNPNVFSLHLPSFFARYGAPTSPTIFAGDRSENALLTSMTHNEFMRVLKDRHANEPLAVRIVLHCCGTRVPMGELAPVVFL
jgi:hypothetical protein